MSNTDSFFVLDKDIFIGRDPARGPWSPQHCHGGPVAGIIAREMECLIGAEKELVRLTVDLLRPVPINGVRIKADVVRNGRRVATTTSIMTDLENRVCATASGVHIAPNMIDNVPTAIISPLSRERVTPGLFPVLGSNHDQPFFSNFAEVAYPEGEERTIGPTTLWMKTLPLLDSEPTSPFQQLCPLADCGNGISRNGELTEFNFLNTDLTVTAYRRPTSQWLATQSTSHWHENGIGLSQSVLYDEIGVIGVALQTLVLSKV